MATQGLPDIRPAMDLVLPQSASKQGPECDPGICMPSTGGWLADCCESLSKIYGISAISCASLMLNTASMALLGRRGIGPNQEHIPASLAAVIIDDNTDALRACRERLLQPFRIHQQRVDTQLRQPAIEAQRNRLVLDSRRKRLTAIASGTKKDDDISPEEAESALLDCLREIDELTTVRLPQRLLQGQFDDRLVNSRLPANNGKLGIILDQVPPWSPILEAGLTGGAYDTRPSSIQKSEHLKDILISINVCCNRSTWDCHQGQRYPYGTIHQHALLITAPRIEAAHAGQVEQVDEAAFQAWDKQITKLLREDVLPETSTLLHFPPTATDSDSQLIHEIEQDHRLVSSLATRITLILARLDSSQATIPCQFLLDAGAAWRSLALQHRQATLRGISTDSYREKRIEKVIRWINSNHQTEFKRSELHRSLRGRNDHVRDWQDALDILVSKGLISCQAIKPANGGHVDVNIHLTQSGRKVFLMQDRSCA